MKKFLIFIFISTLLSSCEDDDFCSEPTTPNLIIRLRDIDTEETKTRILSVKNKNTTLLEEQTIDSIVVPINTLQNSTQYQLTSDVDITEITLNYEIEDIYVSKSCGFKSIFKNVSISIDKQGWLQDYNLQTSTIENQTQAHVQIFH